MTGDEAGLDTPVGRRVAASFARQSLMASVGARLVCVEPGRVVLEAGIGEGFRQQGGFAHGALVFALGDTAAGYAALTVLEEGSEVMTAELKINFLRPGAGRLVAEGRVVQPGRRLVVVTAQVWSVAEDGTRRMTALLQGSMMPVAMPAALPVASPG